MSKVSELDQLTLKASCFRQREQFASALRLYKKAAEKGDAISHYWIAYIKHFRLATSKTTNSESNRSFRKYFETYLVMADNGNSEACFIVGTYFYYGLPPVEKDCQKALNYLEKSAKGGSALAFNELGSLCHTYLHDDVKALHYYLTSGEMGFPSAYNNAGNIYSYGSKDIPIDGKKAFECYQKAVEMGNRYGQVNLGLLYLNGQYCQRDVSKAFELFTLGAKQHLQRAYYYLGKCFLYGLSVPANEDKALFWLLKATKSDNPNNSALLDIISIYRNKNKTRLANKYSKIAFERFTKQIENKQNFSAPYLAVAKCYENGIGTQRDIGKAIKILQHCPEMGRAECDYRLSKLYGDSTSNFFNNVLSTKYLGLSAEAGFPEAQYAYGLYYENKGEKEEAFRWFSKSAFSSFPWALEKVGIYYLFGLGAQEKNVELAKRCLHSAVDCGDNGALFYLYSIPNGQMGGDLDNAMESYYKGFDWDSLNAVEKVTKIEKDLSSFLDPYWKHFAEETRIALKSGLFTYINYKFLEQKGFAMDFSQASNPFSKALEIELAERFYTPYVQYLEACCNDLRVFGSNPPPFVTVDDKGKYHLAKSNDQKRFTLGSFTKLIGETKIVSNISSGGTSSLGSVRDSSVYLVNSNGKQCVFASFDPYFLNFCESSLNKGKNRIYSKETIARSLYSLAELVSAVTNRYRNIGSHKGIIDSFDAEACGNAIVMRQKLLCLVASFF
jgi:TPR repeat protein